MLELKNIKKDYPAGDGTVHALKGINLSFRDCDFVSILGPSGCGKTTMLNIIGGLDGYTDGDLVIGGTSTKKFKDRDWDAYRNHSIGFVFQSYNLITHQTVLKNVELALTLSGVSKSERRERAKKALEDVGLGNQLNKKPGEMSGGQMQRVAIARALVNDPDIILADEPTGALDSETSVQVMEILKKISRDRLIIMVTHNPELAEKYSTRIIRMLDGNVTDDSAPMSEAEISAAHDKENKAAYGTKKVKLPSMSFATSFSLSLRNLFSKKGRTTLTAFAGSIGIIGIALILSVSQGLSSYIDTVQEDTLSSYPLTIEKTHVDFGSLMTTFLGTAESGYEHANDAVYSKPIVRDMIQALNNVETTENDLKSFKNYIEDKMNSDSNSELYNAVSGIQYTYDLDMLIYTENVDGTIICSDAEELMQKIASESFGIDMSMMMGDSDVFANSPVMSMMSSGGSSFNVWQEMLPGDNGSLVNSLLKKQYNLIYGSWPTQYNEVIVLVDEDNEIDDMTLYALGLKSKDDVDKIVDAALNKTDLEADTQSWSYEDICSMEFRTILNSDCYSLDTQTGLYTDLRESETGLRYLYDNGTVLKVSGIIKPSEDAVSGMLSGTIGYTTMLTEYITDEAAKSEVAAKQIEDQTTDIFTGLPFKSNSSNMTIDEKSTEFKNHINSLDEIGKAEAYITIKSIPDDELLNSAVEQAIGSMTREDMENILIGGMSEQTGMTEDKLRDYVSSMSDEALIEIFENNIIEQTKIEYAEKVLAQLSDIPTDQLASLLDSELLSFTSEQCAVYYDEALTFSESSYENNLKQLGIVDRDDPATINLYSATFQSKDIIEEAIKEYNSGVDELSEIKYTDYVGLMMSSVTTIINAITYVLVAFVAISLIVSSIMIGVITLISVQERTKEIGILRAIGASKKNVSSMFNAETVIIGFLSGALGVGVTYLLCIPINIIIQGLTGISGLSAFLPIPAAIILIAISIALTLISGIIPSRSAAKKDPVVALRTE